MPQRSKIRAPTGKPTVIDLTQQPDGSDEDLDSEEAFDSSDEGNFAGNFSRKNSVQDENESVQDDDMSNENDVEDTDDWLSKVFGNKSNETASNEEEEIDEDEAQDTEENHEALTKFVDSMNNGPGKEAELRRKAKRRRIISQRTVESEYSGNAFRLDDETNQLTINQLLANSTTDQSAGLHRRLEDMSKSGTTRPALSQAILDKSSRKLAYTSSKQEMTSRWQHQVSSNRIKPTIDFCNDERVRLNSNDLASNFAPKPASYEEQIEMILVKSGLDDEKSMIEKERKELLESDVNLVAIQERQAELGKLGYLLHSYERKRHFVKQIKSKAYRRIRRRLRDDSIERDMTVLKQIDPVLFQLLQEKEAMKKVEERMTMKRRSLKKISLANSMFQTDDSDSANIANNMKIALDVTSKMNIDVKSDGHESLESVASQTRFKNLFNMKFMQQEEEEDQQQEEDDDDDDDKEKKKKIVVSEKEIEESMNIVKSLLNKTKKTTIITSTSTRTTTVKAAPAIQVRQPFQGHELLAEINADGDDEYNDKKKKKTGNSNEIVENDLAPDLNAIPSLSQQDLISLAFADNQLEADFLANKQTDVEDEVGVSVLSGQEGLPLDKPGWGDWTGMGSDKIPVSKKTKLKRKRNEEKKRELAELNQVKKLEAIQARKDARMPLVMISEKRVKTGDKYKIRSIPFPFTSEEQYARTMEMPLGPEWNTLGSVKWNTQPEIKKRRGRIIDPIQATKKV